MQLSTRHRRNVEKAINEAVFKKRIVLLKACTDGTPLTANSVDNYLESLQLQLVRDCLNELKTR